MIFQPDIYHWIVMVATAADDVAQVLTISNEQNRRMHREMGNKPRTDGCYAVKHDPFYDFDLLAPEIHFPITERIDMRLLAHIPELRARDMSLLPFFPLQCHHNYMVPCTKCLIWTSFSLSMHSKLKNICLIKIE